MTRINICDLAHNLCVPHYTIAEMARDATAAGFDVGYVPGTVDRKVVGSVDAQLFAEYQASRSWSADSADMFAMDDEPTPYGAESLEKIAKTAKKRAIDQESIDIRQRAAVRGLEIMMGNYKHLSRSQMRTAAELKALWLGCDGKTFNDVKLHFKRGPLLICNRPYQGGSLFGSQAQSLVEA